VRRDGAAVGPWRLLARDVAHLLDTVSLFIGWLWPLWDSRNRTFADLLMRTEVRRVPRTNRDVRRLAAVVLLIAALLCGAGAGLSYLVVYRHDQAVDQARDQIAKQGPKIVEEMLSYKADSLQADFAHAQSLATDAYRPQLVAQQQAAQKAGAATNEYWVVTSSVLNVSPDRASMLLLMQGQRGAGNPPQQRFITATVRAGFEKSATGQWRVAEITVLAKPQTTNGGK
jgi:Mce-associated membrane protein